MKYFTAAEFSEKLGISCRMAAYYCEKGRIDGAVKKGKIWFIPENTEKPADKRASKNRIVIQDNSSLQGDFELINKPDNDNNSVMYHVNDLYKNLNITRDTLRYYEEIGLVTPGRDRNSQYREFTFTDVYRLMSIDFYRKRGFTPLEIKKLMKTEKQSDCLQYLNRKMIDLKENILGQKRILKRLEDTLKFYKQAGSIKEKFLVKELPLYLVRESFDAVSSFSEYRSSVLNYIDLHEEDILSSLVRAVTFDSSGYKGTGMCIVQPAGETGQKNGQTYLENGKCLYTVLEADSHDDSIMEKMFIACHEWAEKQHEEFKGVVYIFISFVAFSGHAERNFYEVWIPLK